MSKVEKDEFFKDVVFETHNLNLCAELNFNESSNIEKIDIFYNGIYSKSFEKEDFDNVVNGMLYPGEVSNAMRANFISHTRKLFEELESKHKLLTMPISKIKVIMIFDAKNLILQHWTSFPVLNNDGQVKEYFDNIIRFANMALEPDELSNLQEYVDKILSKMLGGS
jgi:hypothetical protein